MRERPEPLPPDRRTVGQLVAEALRLYGDRFWTALLLGVAPAASGVALASLGRTAAYVWPFTAGALANAVSYYGAVLIANRRRFDLDEARVAIAAGFIVFVPFSILAALFLLPAALWLGLVGLAVPAAVLEGRGLRSAFVRAFELGRADYVHALGAFAALILVIIATTFALFFLLRGQGEAARAVAGFLSVLVISPLLFLGASLLYFDQAARVVDSRAKPS